METLWTMCQLKMVGLGPKYRAILLHVWKHVSESNFPRKFGDFGHFFFKPGFQENEMVDTLFSPWSISWKYLSFQQEARERPNVSYFVSYST